MLVEKPRSLSYSWVMIWIPINTGPRIYEKAPMCVLVGEKQNFKVLIWIAQYVDSIDSIINKYYSHMYVIRLIYYYCRLVLCNISCRPTLGSPPTVWIVATRRLLSGASAFRPSSPTKRGTFVTSTNHNNPIAKTSSTWKRSPTLINPPTSSSQPVNY